MLCLGMIGETMVIQDGDGGHHWGHRLGLEGRARLHDDKVGDSRGGWSRTRTQGNQ